MKYKKGVYKKVLCCPECNFSLGVSSDDMPERYDWLYKTDYDGKDYIECYCGCEFTEK